MHAWRGFLFLLSTLIWVHLAFISKLFSATVINDDDNVPKLTVLEPTELKLNRQTVQVPQGIRAFDISNGTLLHLKCLGSQPLSWSFPTNHMVSQCYQLLLWTFFVFLFLLLLNTRRTKTTCLEIIVSSHMMSVFDQPCFCLISQTFQGIIYLSQYS